MPWLIVSCFCCVCLSSHGGLIFTDENGAGKVGLGKRKGGAGAGRDRGKGNSGQDDFMREESIFYLKKKQ